MNHQPQLMVILVDSGTAVVNEEYIEEL